MGTSLANVEWSIQAGAVATGRDIKEARPMHRAVGSEPIGRQSRKTQTQEGS